MQDSLSRIFFHRIDIYKIELHVYHRIIKLMYLIITPSVIYLLYCECA